MGYQTYDSRKETFKRYRNTMPPRKRPYTLDTILFKHTDIVRRMAQEWWGIDPAGKTKLTLAWEIQDAQEAGG